MHHHTMSMTCHHANFLSRQGCLLPDKHVTPSTPCPSQALQHMQDESMQLSVKEIGSSAHRLRRMMATCSSRATMWGPPLPLAPKEAWSPSEAGSSGMR